MTQKVSDEQKSRLLLMAQGDPTWDLSQNDCDAISAALFEINESRAHGPYDVCTCGHERCDHERGAFGANAASNCNRSTCTCQLFKTEAE